MALRAARRNLPAAAAADRLHLGDGWSALPPLPPAGPEAGPDAGPPCLFEWVVSNPPVHREDSDDFAVLEALVRGAPGRLRPGGCLWLVAQECVPVGAVFNAAGASLYRCAPPARHA